MPTHRKGWLSATLLLGMALVAVVLAVTSPVNAPLLWVWVLPGLFIGAVLTLVWISRPLQTGRTSSALTRLDLLLAELGGVVTLLYAFTSATAAAWGTLVFLYSLFLILDEIILARLRIFPEDLPWGTHWLRTLFVYLAKGSIHLVFALVCGGVSASLAQIESHFAEEEFYVLLQGLVLAGYWLFLRLVLDWFQARTRRRLGTDPARLETNVGEPEGIRRVTRNTNWLVLAVAALLGVYAFFTLWSYQQSFYPDQAPTFPGISVEDPFLCGQGSPDPQTYTGVATFQRLLRLVEANPRKSTPEFGMLALGSGEDQWKQRFHDSLLEEARQGLFTSPAGNVKSVQYKAAQRVYYYVRTREAFPGLFTPAEEESIRQWLADINRRALTVEGVDWLYALAFRTFPDGPYLNQDTGAGLLALLQASGLSDPALSERNQEFLDARTTGWAAAFRVSDDSALYQSEWIDNAFFQSLDSSDYSVQNMRNAFDWLILLSPPDGLPLKYNHTGLATLDGISLLGAQLSGSKTALWMAGRAMDYLEEHGMYSYAQPGVVVALDLVGQSPWVGSCLLYGNSGLPTRSGELAPDKIVFRSGWGQDSLYLLLNLRFTGWHRYKATNDIVLAYQDGPLVEEDLGGDIPGWLPSGRDVLRDKRIPRQDLNGLVVARSGLSALVSSLTGIGGAWAQDPPYYASIQDFYTGLQVDGSTTVLSGWRGWTHTRQVLFHHNGLIVVVDDASGPPTQPAMLNWNLPAAAQVREGSILLRQGDSPVEMLVFPLAGATQIIEGGQGLRLQVQNTGTLSAVTIILTGDWVGANASLEGDRLVIRGLQVVEIPLP